MVWRAIILASLLCISILPATAQADGEGCLSVDLDSFREVRYEGRLAGVVGWDRAVGYTAERLPMVPTLLAVRGETACDLTHGLDAFLGSRTTPKSGADALLVATLAIDAIYVDVLPQPVVLPSLGFSASAPKIVRTADGYVADLTVWTLRNGVIADARVTMEGDTRASFVVRERVAGAFVGEAEGWNLLPGMTDKTVAGDVSGLATKILMGTNADGKKWRVTYFTQNYVNEATADYHAQMHLTGALAAYANETAWGFVSPDPDGTLDLTLDGCDCIYGGNNANIHMFPRANDILPLLPGLNYREERETAQLIVGHELFHHMQYGIMQWRHGNWAIEGTARFQETVNVPDMAFLPTTLTYWPNLNGMNGFLLAPSGPISSHWYDWSIVWGYLYANEGGMPLIKAVLEEMATGGTYSEIDGPAAIQRAMDRVPGGTHQTFAEAYTAFAQDIFTHDNFVWGATDGTQVHDWSTYFVATKREFTATGSFNNVGWSIRAHNADPTNAAGAAVMAYTANPNLAAFAYSETGGVRTSTPALPVTALAGVDDAALIMVRANGPAIGENLASGSYAFAIVK